MCRQLHKNFFVKQTPTSRPLKPLVWRIYVYSCSGRSITKQLHLRTHNTVQPSSQHVAFETSQPSLVALRSEQSGTGASVAETCYIQNCVLTDDRFLGKQGTSSIESPILALRQPVGRCCLFAGHDKRCLEREGAWREGRGEEEGTLSLNEYEYHSRNIVAITISVLLVTSIIEDMRLRCSSYSAPWIKIKLLYFFLLF